MNLQKFYMGESFDTYEYFGAHLEDGGVVFRTYAPNTWGINVMGEFNSWNEEPLQQLHQTEQSIRDHVLALDRRLICLLVIHKKTHFLP